MGLGWLARPAPAREARPLRGGPGYKRGMRISQAGSLGQFW
jgi:hypothetical protein